ncbi:MAG TPA: anti-sigma factor [Armatimonadota bacterium]|nr:anti-sigma factor [Armatimonadota bacterium]
MNCERARELFSVYLEGSADTTLTAVVRDHIDQCRDCRREYELFRQTWCMLGSLPEVAAPAGFRHDVVMSMARVQHEHRKGARLGLLGSNSDFFLRRFLPVRTITIATAAAALVIILLRVPQSTYEYFAGMFNPGVRIVDSTGSERAPDAIEASPLESGRKLYWQTRKVQRNTVWVTITPDEGAQGTRLYRIALSINERALLPGVITARIGARVFLLPPNRFSPEDVESARPVWEGNILKNSPVLVPVIVDQSQGGVGSVNLLVAWTFRQRNFAYLIFIPARSRASAQSAFNLPMGGRNLRQSDGLYSMLQAIAVDYGVPVIVNAYLEEKPSMMSFGTASLDQTLRDALEPAGLDWLYADKAVYVDRRYEVSPPGQ